MSYDQITESLDKAITEYNVALNMYEITRSPEAKAEVVRLGRRVNALIDQEAQNRFELLSAI
jgi:hypothetical protein